jgi:hypothetical protein
METTELAKMIDHERWLLNNGLVSDSVKNQLFFCGSIVHKEVQAVEVRIVPEKKLVEYILYVTPELLKKIAQYRELNGARSLFSMWRFKRLLAEEGCLDFQQVLTSFVKDYCGGKWSATASVLSFDSYVDSIEVGDDNRGNGESDKLPDVG